MRLISIFLVITLFMPYSYAFDSNDADSQKTQKQYVFYDDDTMRGKVVKIKKGTVLPIVMLTPIDTATAQKNDKVEAMLDEDLKIDGVKVASKGSMLYGKITKARCATYAMRGGKVKINFYKIVTGDNRILDITTKALEFVISESEKWVKVARSFLEIAILSAYVVMSGGTALVVIALGVVTGVPIGITLLDTKGADAVIPISTPVEVSLDSSVKTTASY